MPPEQRSPDDPHEWLRRARSNLARAQADIRLAGVYLEDLCFDAQQAAEKAIKAVLIERSIRFPYVHDLTVLLGLVEQSGTTVPEVVREAGRLTRFAVVTRYPGIAEPVTQEEYERAVAIAEAVIDWARKTVLRHP
jgi:HEPN domain-containing protein